MIQENIRVRKRIINTFFPLLFDKLTLIIKGRRKPISIKTEKFTIPGSKSVMFPPLSVLSHLIVVF